MSLSFLYDHAPITGPLARVVGQALPGASVAESGGMLEQVFVDAVVDGYPLRLRFVTSKTNKEGYRPYSYVELMTDPGAPMYLGGAHVGYPSYERVAAFAHPGAAHRRWVGAPGALVDRIGAGSLGARIATIDAANHGEVLELAVGEYAGKRTPGAGIHLHCRGWPADPATLRFLVDTVLELAHTVRASLPPSGSFAAEPEVVHYFEARNKSRERALLVVALVMGGLALLVVVGIVLAIALR